MRAQLADASCICLKSILFIPLFSFFLGLCCFSFFFQYILSFFSILCQKSTYFSYYKLNLANYQKKKNHRKWCWLANPKYTSCQLGKCCCVIIDAHFDGLRLKNKDICVCYSFLQKWTTNITEQSPSDFTINFMPWKKIVM